MRDRDWQRLVKLDEEIISLRIAYERERQNELLLNKHTLLLSRGIKYKLDACIKARGVLARLMKNAPTARKTHNDELQNRKMKVKDAEEELSELEKHLVTCAIHLRNFNDDDNKLRFKEAEYEVKRQKIRIAAFERSVTNYAKRGEVIPQRMTKARVEADQQFAGELEDIYKQAENFIEKEEEKHAPKRLEDTALGQTASFKENKLDDNRFNMIHQLKPTGLGGGWGDSTSNYEPPPQRTKITID